MGRCLRGQIRSALIILVVRSGLVRRRGWRIVITWRRRGAIARNLLLRRHLVVGLEHRAATAGELGRVLRQAARNAAHIRDLIAAQPPHIRRAGHLLLHGSAILFSGCSALRGDAADRKRHTQRNPLCSHVRFLRESLEFCPINETRRGSGPTKNCENGGGTYSTLPIFFTAAISRALSTATNSANAGAS